MRRLVASLAVTAVLAGCAPPPDPFPFPFTGSAHVDGRYSVIVIWQPTVTCTATLDVGFTLVGESRVDVVSAVTVHGDMPNCTYAAWSLDAFMVCGPVPVFCGQTVLGVRHLEQTAIRMPFTLSPDSAFLRVTFTATLYGFAPKSGSDDTPQIKCRNHVCLFQPLSPN